MKIPRLFATLFLLPLLLSLAVVYGQLLITGTIVRVSDQDAGEIEKRFKKRQEYSVIRQLLYGDANRRPELKVCRWSYRDLGQGQAEYPPSPDCNPDRLDVALRVNDPATFDPANYVEMFQGNVDRIHLCRTCRPDVTIHAESQPTRADMFSIQGMMVLGLIDFTDTIQAQRLQAAMTFDHTMGLVGQRYLHATGFTEPIQFSGVRTRIAFICSISFLVIITLWLALKAHRRVLDYFARNSALLPMVAAVGKRDFYAAIWLLTLFRVGAFLIAAVPLTIVAYLDFDKKNRLNTLFSSQQSEFLLWSVALIMSMALASMIASIADLKQRHSFMSFVYRYIPLVICAAGALLWSATFIVDGQGAATVRDITTSLPILGIAPILIAPVFKPQLYVLALHTVLTLGLFVLLVRHNTNWFAAHLEEL